MYSFRVPFEVIKGAPDTNEGTLELAVCGETSMAAERCSVAGLSTPLASGFDPSAAAAPNMASD